MSEYKLQDVQRIVENIGVLLMRGHYPGDMAQAIAEAFSWTQTFKTSIEKAIADVQAEQTKAADSTVAAQNSDGVDSERDLDRKRGDSKGNAIPARSPRNRTRKTKT